MTPLDIIAQAIRTSCDGEPPSGLARPLAAVAVNALTDERIVAHATKAFVAALDDAGFTVAESGEPAGVGDLRDLAAAVLRSVGA